MIHLDTITPKMQEVAKELHSHLPQSYYLAGGTALALLTGHRESVDLDYFTPEHIDTMRFKTLLLSMFPKVVFTYEDVDTLWCDIDGVKVSFIARPVMLLDPPQEEEYFRIASVRDLVAMKLNAVCGRDEYKDYYDLAELATMTDAREWGIWWRQVYPQSDPIAWMVALSHVGSVAPVSLRGSVIRSYKEVEEKILAVVKELSSFVG